MKAATCWRVGGAGVFAIVALAVAARARADAPLGYFAPSGGVVAVAHTGLTWQAVPSPSTLTWPAAEMYCADLDIDGIDDWRLPTVLELLSIIDTEGAGPELLDGLFTSGVKPEYWSSTRDQGFPNRITVDVRFGAPGSRPEGSPSYAIARCVR